MKLDLDSDDMQVAKELVRECRYAVSRISGSRGEEFADALLDRVESINDFMESRHFVTEKQIQALRNMYEGLLKWV